MSGMFDDRFEEAEPVAPQPIDLKGAQGEAEAYPVEALSPSIRATVEAIVDIAQVPPALAAQSVLAAAALTAQSRINVRLLTRQVVPVSLFLFTVAASGDRKSTSDRHAVDPIKAYEQALQIEYEQARLAFNIEDAAQKALARKANSGSKTKGEITELLAQAGAPAVAPALPILIADEPTAQGLQRLFAEAQPSLALFSDEGAAWLGGYSMQDEHQAATGAMLSKLWDGAPIRRVRANRDEVVQILRGRRLSLHLMVQPGVAGKLFGSRGLRDQGMLSRMLVAQPKSLKGTRMWREPQPVSFEHLEAYQARMAKRLQRALVLKDITTRELALDVVDLTPEARARMVEFTDHCEISLRPGGPYEDISDFASKMPENATRLAAVMADFEARIDRPLHVTGLSLNAINAGIRIVQFYATEAIRLYGGGSTDDDTDNAQALIDFIHKRGLRAVGKQWLNRYAPKQVRPATLLSRALDLLVEHNHLVVIGSGSSIDHGNGAKFYKDAYTVVGEAAA